MAKHILEADSILFNIGDNQLLTDVYLSCQTGEIVGLLGRNGCGKTTLLKIIFGTKAPDHKHIRLDGEVYQEPFRQKGLLAYLPQHDFLPKNIKLKQIINFYHHAPLKQKLIKQDKRIRQHLNKFADELSKGERRYFELMILLHLDVKFLLLDEPFSGVEPLYIEHIEELLQMHLPDKGFILTDHDYRTVLRASNRIVLLINGSCKHIRNQEDLMTWGYIPEGI
ncbi:ATP-binding cassette domain-containing protein [Pontibacter sp. MBLB2868]|uniref:ATP-binding cassette domain-containing protein n=1 Tax=Pontibacter sp. MBLB2868 TaxID=3451555 RepID=UPI003F74C9C3